MQTHSKVNNYSQVITTIHENKLFSTKGLTATSKTRLPAEMPGDEQKKPQRIANSQISENLFILFILLYRE